jgi:hypothetical protein
VGSLVWIVAQLQWFEEESSMLLCRQWKKSIVGNWSADLEGRIFLDSANTAILPLTLFNHH